MQVDVCDGGVQKYLCGELSPAVHGSMCCVAVLIMVSQTAMKHHSKSTTRQGHKNQQDKQAKR